MLLAPPGWTQVELEIAVTARGLQIASLQSKGDGAKEPRPAPQLMGDPREEAIRFGEALTELQRQLKGKWQPGSVRVERASEAFVDWKLLGPSGAVAWFGRLERGELNTLLITDPLFDALRGTERAFHELQGQLQRRLTRVTGFAFDATHGVLRLDRPTGPLELPAQLVGSYLPDVFTWVWGWSEEGPDSLSTDRVKRVCQPDLKPDGLSALWRPNFHCDESFAWALSGHVAVSVGARGLFRAQPPEAEGALFFAILELPPEIRPQA